MLVFQASFGVGRYRHAAQGGGGSIQFRSDVCSIAMTRSVLHPHPHQNHVFSLFFFLKQKLGVQYPLTSIISHLPAG